MDTFEIGATIAGELVSLHVSYLGKFPDPGFDYYTLSCGDNLICIIKVDGSCEIEIDSGEIEPVNFPRICEELRKRKLS